MTTLVPAYGRDYKTAKDAKAAWAAGKDWQIADLFHPDDGRYTSRTDWPGQTVMLRFCRLTKTCAAREGSNYPLNYSLTTKMRG